MILADLELVAIIILSGALGFFVGVLWQNWRARPQPQIDPSWIPRQLVDDNTVVLKPGQRVVSPATKPWPSLDEHLFDSPYAPKGSRRPEPLRTRANKLKHWPRAFPETEKPPAMVEAKPRHVEQPAQSIEPWHARDDLPKIEFGSGA